MENLSRTIAIMSVMAGISSTARNERDELCIDKTLENLFATGKMLGQRFYEAKQSEDESDLSAFYEEFGNIISKFKTKEQIDVISKSFSEEVLVFEEPESDAVSFTDLRMSVLRSDDIMAVADVDAAFYMAVEKRRIHNGNSNAEKFRLMCEYANAGAMLGAEFADAKRSDDLHFAESVKQKADALCDSLPSDTYGNIFRRAYNYYSVNA